MSALTFSREDFYQLIWSESISSIAKRFSLTDYEIRKACIKFDIPTPRAGYWQNIKLGKTLPVPSLPKSNIETVSIVRKVNNASRQPVTIAKSEEAVPLPKRLISSDPLIVAVRKHLDSKKRERWGLRDGLVSSYGDYLNINVSPGNIERALIFMDTFIKAMRRKGHTIVLKNNLSYVVILGEEFMFSIKEKQKRVQNTSNNSYLDTHLIPTGLLSFRTGHLYVEKEWIDAEKLMEANLEKIITYLEAKANRMKEESAKREVWWAALKAKERMEEEIQERRKKELSDFKEVLIKASRWHKAENLRSYIRARQQKAVTENKLCDELQAWVQWASKKADWYDPFTEEEDDLLQDINRDTLAYVE